MCVLIVLVVMLVVVVIVVVVAHWLLHRMPPDFLCLTFL
jgi:hypothetical protein